MSRARLCRRSDSHASTTDCVCGPGGERLTEALADAYGLGGRARKMGDPAERMRKAVTIQIRRTLQRINGAHPALGRHLTNGLRTGIFCSYTPELPVAWSV